MRNILFSLLILFIIGLLQVHAETTEDVDAEPSGRFLQACTTWKNKPLQAAIALCENEAGCKWCYRKKVCMPLSSPATAPCG